MAIGTYEETLPCGGKLYVNGASWGIKYYFKGPDFRYNGTFFTAAGSNIANFISALQANWKEFLKIKEAVPAGGSFTKPGQMGMTIRVGSFAQGVCLHGHHMPIASDMQLQQLVASYMYASDRAPRLQKLLSTLG